MLTKIFIHISEESQFVFNHAALQKVKSKAATSDIFFDLDNHSEKDIVAYAVRLVEDSEQLQFIFYIEKLGNEPDIQSLFPLISKLKRNWKKSHIFQVGSLPKLELLLGNLPKDRYLKLTNEKALLTILFGNDE